ncbi:hypothetical protein [Patulibacter minatonensis]|uniref:hypothetical protein n=1 Tax=Patulibacter minatonensis TaxID=298163 RepID=UPI0004BA0226|nr:hypothetical protein [Patulibacter minatonensis]
MRELSREITDRIVDLTGRWIEGRPPSRDEIDSVSAAIARLHTTITFSAPSTTGRQPHR